jgi:hypothetical protein
MEHYARILSPDSAHGSFLENMHEMQASIREEMPGMAWSLEAMERATPEEEEEFDPGRRARGVHALRAGATSPVLKIGRQQGSTSSIFIAPAHDPRFYHETVPAMFAEQVRRPPGHPGCGTILEDPRSLSNVL